MKEGWEIKKFGDLCKFVRGPFGGSLKKSEFVNSGFAVYEQQHAIYNQFTDIRYFINTEKFDAMKRFELCANDLIMSCSGTMGKVAIVPRGIPKGIINQALLKLTPLKSILLEFLKYWMDSPSFQEGLKAQAGGAAIQNVASVGILKEIEIYLPPISEQKRIVAILDKAFENIAIAKANAEQNLKNSRDLFESYLQSVFTQKGDGRELKTLETVCEISSKLIDPKKEDFLELIHIGAGNIESKTGALIELKTAKEEGLISGKFLFDEDMVLYSKIRPYLMKVVRPDFSGLCSADIYPLTPKINQITRDYLFYLLLTPHFTEYAIKGSARAGMPKVNREHLFEYSVYLPSIQDQNKFSSKLDALFEKTQHLESIYQQKIAALDELKKSLLHKAFSGEL